MSRVPFRRSLPMTGASPSGNGARGQGEAPLAKPSGWELWKTVPRVLPYVRPYRKRAGFSLLLTVLASVTALAIPWPLALMLDYLSAGEPTTSFLFFGLTNKYAILAAMVALGFFLTVATHALTVINSFVDTRLEQGMVLDLRSDLFEHAQELADLEDDLPPAYEPSGSSPSRAVTPWSRPAV